MAAEARSAGHGGVAATSRATQVARSTIGRGLKDLRDPASLSGKVRRLGAGRLTLVVKDPTLLEDPRQLLEPATMGDPGRLLRWVSKSHEKLASALVALGHTVGKSSPKLLVRELARLMPDKSIAAVLNRAGKPTGRNNGWTQSRVCTFRNHRGFEVYREGERRERGELTLDETAAALNVSAMTVLRMIRRGVIDGRQLCKGAPWVIKASDIDGDRVRAEADGRRRTPLTANPDQQTLAFQ